MNEIKNIDKTIDTYIDSLNFKKELKFNKSIPKSVEEQMKKDFKKYIKESDELEEKIIEIQEEYESAMKEADEEFNKLTEDIDINTLIERIEALLNAAKENKNIRFINKYSGILNELKSSLTLDLMFKNLTKMKNPQKILDKYSNISYTVAEKRFRDNLEFDSKHVFGDPINLHSILEFTLPEGKKHYSKIFLFSLYKIVNVNKKKQLEKYSIFIAQIIKNIYNLGDNTPNSKLLLDSIIKYGDTIYKTN